MKTRELIRRISDSLGEPTADTGRMLRTAVHSIKEALAEGKVVHLGQLGRIETDPSSSKVTLSPRKAFLKSIFGNRRRRAGK